MSAHTSPQHAGAAHDHDAHGPKHYVKIWAILLVLFMISVLGPMVEIRWLTLITAFGIAIVKATMVAQHFMHLKVEKRYITYILLGMLLMVGLFFVAVASDVMKSHGNNWINKSATDIIEHHKANPGTGAGGHHP